MKFKVRIGTDGHYDTVFLWIPPFNLVGLLFEWNGRYFKILDVMYQATNKQLNHDDNDALPKITVTEIPVICP